MKIVALKFAVILAMAASGQHCHADIAYSNFGSGNSYDSATGAGFGNVSQVNSLATNYHLARGFTAEAAGRLFSIELPMSFFPNLANSGPGAASLGLWSHDPGAVVGRPGQLLWTGQSALITNSGLDFEIYEIMADQNAPIIESGTVYWGVASAEDGLRPLLWAPNNDALRIGKFGFSYSETNDWLGEANSTEQAFRVNVNAIPEPNAFAGSFLLCFAFLRRRRARAVSF